MTTTTDILIIEDDSDQRPSSMDNAEVWAGGIGNAYHQRQVNRVPADIELFARILDRTQNVESVIEFGAGQGDNLLAIRRLLPDARLTGVEVNANACAMKWLSSIGFSEFSIGASCLFN
jgi:hypothetical protein